ncbi:thiamine phosphate phosphatase-like protein isoform X1 [Quercus suber]|uniref:thiamine phosphate phosphatase-like protein isoform X1 n=2 Tax=Quercus suber TaxID=58331 RepID=UPI0032DF4794
MARVVIVFDFDKTIIDCDSDNWIVDELGVTQLFTQLLPTLPWNSLMDRMLMELHSQGKTIEVIAECLKKVPLNPRIISSIKSAHASGCDLRIVSDANAFFIETILKHHGLINCFSEINTNPSFIDREGRLRILQFHDLNSPPHGCNICPPNMCKGLIMEKIRASVSAEGNKRFIYLGDGSADFCASLKLEGGDFLMPRKDFPIWEIICTNQRLIKASIHEWSNGEDLETTLLKLLNSFFLEEEKSSVRTDQLVEVDCKFLTSSIITYA